LSQGHEQTGPACEHAGRIATTIPAEKTSGQVLQFARPPRIALIPHVIQKYWGSTPAWTLLAASDANGYAHGDAGGDRILAIHDSSRLAAVATGRTGSLFANDLSRHENALRDAVAGARILVVGAAGSIGSNTVKTLLGFGPAAVHVIDQNENALAELVRQLRSNTTNLSDVELRTLPLDYGCAITRELLEAEGPYDRVLNFAAIKHVRSEKDSFSILQMLDSNIVKQARFMGWLAETTPNADYFSVSTDKAANPASFMGATKRIMEHVMFDPAFGVGIKGKTNSARFANVAFSNGSLLQSFENRLARGEPLAAPKEIRRYFVSLEESGEICTLASVFAGDGQIAIPKLDPVEHLLPLEDVAKRFLAFHGIEPALYSDEAEAKANLERDRIAERWPLLLTPGDTAGEKPYEEFVASGETAVEIGLSALRAVPWSGLQHGGSVAETVNTMAQLVLGETRVSDKDALKALIGALEPGFLDSHKASDRNLDQRV